jgi:hypothetical protein
VYYLLIDSQAISLRALEYRHGIWRTRNPAGHVQGHGSQEEAIPSQLLALLGKRLEVKKFT